MYDSLIPVRKYLLFEIVYRLPSDIFAVLFAVNGKSVGSE